MNRIDEQRYIIKAAAQQYFKLEYEHSYHIVLALYIVHQIHDGLTIITSCVIL